MDRNRITIGSRSVNVLPHPYVLAGLVPAIFFLLFYFYPLTGICMRSFAGESGSATGLLSSFLAILDSGRMRGIIWFTFWQAAVSALLTLVAALPCAYVFSHYRFPGKKLFQTLAAIPFVLPAVVTAAALQAWVGKGGLADSLLGMRLEAPLALIFLAHIFYNFSVMLRIISGFWAGIRGRVTEAATLLGASPFRVFYHITLPLLAPALWAAFVLVFIFCFSSFGIILILGGPGYSTLEAEIYRQAAHLFNLPLAAALSLVQILFTLALMTIYTRFTRRASTPMPRASAHHFKTARTPMEKTMVLGAVFFILVLSVSPMVALVIRSLTLDDQWSLAFYTALFSNVEDSVFYIPPIQAMEQSLFFAGTSLVIALVTGVCAALFIHHCQGRDRLLGLLARLTDPVFMLPLSTSAVTLGFGIIITLDKPPLNLRTSIFLVPIAHALVGFPFVLRTLLPALRAIPRQLPEAATLLGASPLAVFRHVDLPLMARALAAGALFAFTMSLGEFGATLFTSRPETATIPVAIYRFLGQPGAMNYGQAMAMATLLMGATALGYVLIENFRTDTMEGF
ncbi:MAG: iron ABC transporter permease [Desulfobacterales bacterium]|nr:iron ABC transporter permease [Desulfobacterales bacterium]